LSRPGHYSESTKKSRCKAVVSGPTDQGQLIHPTTKESIMNPKNLLTAATALMALIGATAALAEEGSLAHPTPMGSVYTRAEVRADALTARNQGLIPVGERPVFTPALEAGKTRAEVRAETLAAIRVHALDRREHNQFATPEQQSAIEMAGRLAATVGLAAR
jgi:hypothetical protein